MDKSEFTNDQREIVLGAIHSIEPTFKPVYSPPNFIYNQKNPLVQKLNRNVRPIDFKTASINYVTKAAVQPPISDGFRDFTKEQLIEMAQQQLEMETQAYITIKSVQKFPAIDEVVVNAVGLVAVSQ